MAGPNVTDVVAQMTGTWSPGPGVPKGDLDQARSQLATALLLGAQPQQLRTAIVDQSQFVPATITSRPAIEKIVGKLKPPKAPQFRPFVRSTTDLGPTALASVAGMKISSTLGPFVDQLGISHFVDLIPLPIKIPIDAASGNLAQLIVTKLQVPKTNKKVQLGAGSLWIAVSAIVGGGPASFVGLAFSKATADFVNVQAKPGGGILLKPGSKLTLELTLEHQAPTAVPSPIGRDAQEMTVSLPAHVTIVLTAKGAAFTALDSASATAYGTPCAFTRNAAKPVIASVALSYVVLPCDLSISKFPVVQCRSSGFIVSGSAPVESGGWALPITSAAAGDLGPAAGADTLLLQLSTGISAQFGGLNGSEALTDATLVLQAGVIFIVAHNGKRETHDRFLLWGPRSPGTSTAVPPPIARASEIDLTYPRDGLILAFMVAGVETVIASCVVTANIDRPVAADGTRLPLAYDNGTVAFVDQLAGKTAILVGFAPPQSEPGRVIALENALVALRPSSLLVFFGNRSGDRYAGDLVLAFPLGGILPTLPDPYAASFPTPQIIDTPTTGVLAALLSWTPAADPTLAFASFGKTLLVEKAFTLLDVSTNADQFGVSTVGRQMLQPTIDVQALAAPEVEVAVYALPGISWEPVVTDQPVDWVDAFSPNDGPPTLLQANSVDLVRIEPAPALSHFQSVASAVPTRADFTLPFGLMAHMAADPKKDPGSQPTFELIANNYDGGLASGRQLSIKAGANSKVGSAALPGSTTTGSGSPPPVNSGVYGDEVIGDDNLLAAAQFFNPQFAAGAPTAEIPVDRIDLSGYGTSMFSDWGIDDINFVGVVRTRFDVLVGRTAYELVQIQTVVAPHCFRMTRTIIFDRFDTGLVVKHDTGWKARGDGKFECLSAGQVLPGAVQRFTNIHNIQVGSGAPIEFTSPDRPEYSTPVPPPVPPTAPRTIRFVPVIFDADVVTDSTLVGTVTNGKVSPQIAATNLEGWAQVSIGYVASGAEVLTLMDLLGPEGVSGLLGCQVSVGKLAAAPQFTLDVSSLSLTATTARTAGKPYAAAVAVAFHGTPHLPPAWSIARRGAGAQTPTAVDPLTPIPLIRGLSGGSQQWRLLDPADALSVDNPANFYGVLQAAGTSKTFFEHTIIDNAGKALNIDPGHLPNLADVGALLGATDIFPNLGAVLNLDTSPNPLKLSPGGFKQKYDQDINQPDRTIFDLGIVKIVLSYKSPDGQGHVTFVLDSQASPIWSLQINNISSQVFVAGFGSDPLLTIYGNFTASETQKPGFNNIQVEYGSALSFVKTIFSGLGPLIAAIGGEVDLDVGFSQNRLTVRDFLAVPMIPLGFGDIRDITLELGFDAQIPLNASFHVGLGSKEKPFTWLVSPLSGTGAIVLGADQGQLDVFVEAGIGAGLEINLAIASGSASITLEMAIVIQGPNISVAVTLLGQASVDVLDGLASASLTLAATLMVTPKPPLPTFPPHDIILTAAVAVGIHISICWVVSVDFDGSWQFSQDVPVHLP
jgi:hypothetical protein